MIAIVDYKAGNLTSVALALAEIGVADARITSDADEILAADRVVFPGVGAAGASMRELGALGLIPVLQRYVTSGRPFLGICVGCQIIMERSLEDGDTRCLGFLPGGTDMFRPDAVSGIKVPHMGWNQVRFRRPHPVLQGIADGTDFYFVHSYYPTPADRDVVLGETEYGGTVFPAILARDNLVACQFHAEKSGQAGLRLLQNFASWNGRA